MDDTAKPIIMIVEDDPDLAKILRFQLSTEGFAIEAADNGATAYDLVQNISPDCIILDLMMPVMDGFSFLKRLRALNQTKDVPVIVLTASEDERHKRKSHQYLADAFVKKPYNLQELTQLGHRLLSQTTSETGN
jgi:DNA-binding response OmpR family regulator